jgi:tyrosyl-tRNA synthetase
MNIFDDLERRGLLDNFSDRKRIEELLDTPHTIYCGFDPSASSLQLGNFIMITILQRLQAAGHRVIAVLGGATGMIGDPSGKKAERKFLERDQILANAKAIGAQLSKYIDTSDPKKGIIVNNYDWWSKTDVITFLRDYGKNFQINYMLDKDIVKSRLEVGISYAEFSYMILQSGDFAKLYEDYGCNIQIGGGDQWGNLTTALDFVRRKDGDQIPCEVFTFKLITDAAGHKFGKSENGALYLDPTMTSPYHIYQYFMNVSDSDVLRYLYIFDKRDIAEIDTIYKAHMEHPELRNGQRELARVIVTALHGKDVADTCEKMTSALFKDDFSGLHAGELKDLTEGLPSLTQKDPISLLDALVATKLASSKREAREFVMAGAVKVNGTKVDDLQMMLDASKALEGGYVFLKRGKKLYAVLCY